ncbi:MAG: hypothetical protein ABI199_00015 [Bacteroidia bacterium]
MKHFFFVIALFLIGKTAMSQDTIVQTNGIKIIAVVQEVGTTEIKYKKYENRQTSPVYSIPKDQVSMIKYADGTKDVFNAGNSPTGTRPPVPPVAPPPVKPIDAPPPPQKPTTVVAAPKTHYLYFGVRASLFNSYNGGDIDSYWKNLFASETASGDGGLQLDQGGPSFKSIFIGNSFKLSEVDNLNLEFQVDISASHAVYNTAVFLDGSNGDLYFNLLGMNLSGQYLRGLDPLDAFQAGGELGIDYGFLFGSENDNLYIGNAKTTTNVIRTYSGNGFGLHVATVGKYFFGAQKTFGLEVRAGYRILSTDATSSFGYPTNNNMTISWSGTFVTAGIVVQIKAPTKRRS